MKKIIAISLLFCFTLYHFGFYIFYFSYKHKIESDWSARVYDGHPSLQKVLEIPMRLPYLVDQEDFQSTNISFKKDGKSYRGIKKRFVDGSFQLVYVPDIAKIRLDQNLKQWVISLSSDGGSESQNNLILTKSFVKDYLPSSLEASLNYPVPLDLIFLGYCAPAIEELDLPVSTPPPRLG